MGNWREMGVLGGDWKEMGRPQGEGGESWGVLEGRLGGEMGVLG